MLNQKSQSVEKLARVRYNTTTVDRLFVAILLPPEVKTAVFDLEEDVRKKASTADVRWVPMENFHVTLHFLGDQDQATRERLIEKLRKGNYPAPFDLSLSRVSAFPNMSAPSIFHVELAQSEPASLLHRETGNAVASLGIPLDSRAWTPHVTIGRQKDLAKPRASLTVMDFPVPDLSFRVSSFALVRSTLKAEGSVYDPVEEFVL